MAPRSARVGAPPGIAAGAWRRRCGPGASNAATWWRCWRRIRRRCTRRTSACRWRARCSMRSTRGWMRPRWLSSCRTAARRCCCSTASTASRCVTCWPCSTRRRARCASKIGSSPGITARWAMPSTKLGWPPSPPMRTGNRPPMNGRTSASTTPRAPPATPRACCITIAARISMRWAMCCLAACRHMRCICGRCPCSIAMDGAFPGPWRRWPAPACACGGWSPPPSSTPSSVTAWVFSAPRRWC